MKEATRIQIENMKNQTFGVEIEGNNITRQKAAEIAELLRERIRSGKFLLSEPVRPMPTGTTTKKLQIREEPGRNH